MTAAEWKAKSAEAAKAEALDLELPSGMVIRARRPDPAQLLMWGHLPLSLASAAAPGEARVPLTPEQVSAGIALSRDILIYCCVEPRISLAPGEDEIHPREIHDKDLVFLLRWATRREEADALRSFRGERPDDGDHRDGEAIRPEAVDAARDHGSGHGVGVRPGGRCDGVGGAKTVAIRE